MPPLNIVGDFGGGGLLLAYGIACALVEASRSGQGQVVDAAMVDGTAMLMAPFYAARQIGFWSDERGTNMLDTGSPYYDTYECADGGYVAVGAIEPQFYAELLDGLGLDPAALPNRDDRDAVGRATRRVRRHVPHEDARRMGRRSSRDATRASRRCSRWPRRPSIRTTWPGRRSSKSTGCVTPRPRLASIARRASSR